LSGVGSVYIGAVSNIARMVFAILTL
jgi:hypothetical protein